MICVVQSNNTVREFCVLYAGSSAHEAMLVASKLPSCKVTIFKNGKDIKVEAPITQQTSKGS